MIKLIKFFEIAYLVIAIISILEVVLVYTKVGRIDYMFVLFAAVSVGMFFFRRYYRRRLEQRNKE